MEVENQLKEVSFGGIDSSHPHDCWRKGRRPKWDGLFTTIISPMPDKISCIFSQIFDVEHQTQELWGSSWSSRSLTLIFDMDLESWHAQKTSKKHCHGNAPLHQQRQYQTNYSNPSTIHQHHHPTLDLVFSAKQLLQTSRRNLLISPHAQVQVLGSDADIGSRGTLRWETARGWGLEV